MSEPKSARDLPHVFVPSGVKDFCKCWRHKDDPIHDPPGGVPPDRLKPILPKGNELSYAE